MTQMHLRWCSHCMREMFDSDIYLFWVFLAATGEDFCEDMVYLVSFSLDEFDFNCQRM